MAKRIVNLRLSEEMIDIINQQIGDTFTQKFENMVTRCMWELPATEQKLKVLEEDVEERRKALHEIAAEYEKYSRILRNAAAYLKGL